MGELMSEADLKRESKEISLENKVDTGMLCPITNFPLYYIGNIDHYFKDKSTFVSLNGKEIKQTYVKEENTPYFSTSIPFRERIGTDLPAVRYFLPQPGNTWEEYRAYTTGIWSPTIMLPVGLPKEEVDSIIEIESSQDIGINNIMPMVARVAAKTIGFDLVSVQPMSGPIGMLSYLDYSYGVVNKKQKSWKNWRDWKYFLRESMNSLIAWKKKMVMKFIHYIIPITKIFGHKKF